MNTNQEGSNAMSKKETAVFIGAHFEEIEGSSPILPCKLAAKGLRVIFLNPIGAWNMGGFRHMKPGAVDRTRKQALEVARHLGCQKIVWDYPCADVTSHRQEIAVRMAEALEDIQPSFVFLHWPYDHHPDHRMIAQITYNVLNWGDNLSPKLKGFGLTGFGVKEIFAFQAGTGQTYNFWPDFFVLATDKEMRKGERALALYKDFKGDKVWWGDIQAKLAYWGHQAGSPAEGYKFIGPRLPLRGLRLAEILGDEIRAAKANECWHFGKDFFNMPS
jgi:LmbE family N-acetylglucosaminyl deacetylase